jgi:hypothetical protein
MMPAKSLRNRIFRVSPLIIDPRVFMVQEALAFSFEWLSALRGDKVGRPPGSRGAAGAPVAESQFW